MQNLVQSLRLMILISAVTASIGVSADPVAKINLRFKAVLTDRSCEVSTDSKNINVNLNSWVVQDFPQAGNRTTPVPFSIQLAHCNAANVSITFKGQSAQSDASLLALSAQSTANNVAIEILDKSKKRITLGQPSPVENVTGQENPRLNFFANYISTANNIGAGSANATANFELNYD